MCLSALTSIKGQIAIFGTNLPAANLLPKDRPFGGESLIYDSPRGRKGRLMAEIGPKPDSRTIGADADAMNAAIQADQ
jgi:hypothetical protein